MRTTLELAQEVGYAKLSIEGIAARTGVGKHTIYRRWPSKGAVFLDALLSSIEADLGYPYTGDLVADLRVQMTHAVNLLAAPPYDRLYAALVGEAQHDPAVAKTLYERFIRPQSDRTIDRLKKAQEDGQLSSGLDLETTTAALYGAYYHKLLLTPFTLSSRDVELVLDVFFTIGTHPPVKS
ncbi:TetR/AcrR family transcriptional regulator [Streptomyces qinzhouensis]|uniref:TetR/AcrR family transcriptional regulator n=2 Tax=Streptomyces qinzhouensis TaxID=2599401 RepID=A0A5B8JT19_9ACTN|nr:TetR/AcrR family transcriptional regulator [Streptomyces qinzhouensis]